MAIDQEQDGGGGPMEPHDEMTGEVVGSGAGAIVKREGFGSTEITRQAETAAIAVAERQRAMVESRYVMALRRPRSILDVHAKLMAECQRPGFAEVARYKRPQGKKKVVGDNGREQWVENIIEGPSIRFVETCVRLMGNISVETATLFDDDQKRILQIEALDYETGASWRSEITIAKTIERRELKRGQKPIAVRRNSYGDDVFILPATDDDVRLKQAALVSKEARTLALRIIPGDLIEEGQQTCIRTLQRADAQDPAAARKQLVGRFLALGVTVAQLVEYLGGQPIEQLTGDQMLELRAVGATIKEGEATWAQCLEASPYRQPPPATTTSGDAAAAPGAAPVPPASEAVAKARSSIQAKVEAAKEKRRAAKTAPAGAQPPTQGAPEQSAQPAQPTTPAEKPQREPGDDG